MLKTCFNSFRLHSFISNKNRTNLKLSNRWWIDGWVGGGIDVKVVLWVVYRNQKDINISDKKIWDQG